MNLYINENIKRLRKEKNITQEKLAQRLNISTTAVSKWERGETYPDISMVIPLANYFGVSTDELLGLDISKNEAKINWYLEEHKNLQEHGKYKEASLLVYSSYKEFPNDFRIINQYLWEIVGGTSKGITNILNHEDEIFRLCFRIIDECNIDYIRYSANSILAKLYFAKGDKEKALEIINRFPSWYGCVKGQECERLFEKGSEEWWYWINRNLFDLSFFALDKIEKMTWYSSKTFPEKLNVCNNIINYLVNIVEETKYYYGYFHIFDLYSSIVNQCINEAMLDDAVTYIDLCLSYAKKIDDFLTSDIDILNAPKQLKSEIVADWGSSDKYNQVKRMISIYDGAEKYKELRTKENYISIINKYRPYALNI